MREKTHAEAGEGQEPTDEMVVRGAEVLHDRLGASRTEHEHDATGIEQSIAEAVFEAMAELAPKPATVQQESAAEIADLRRQLAAAQARLGQVLHFADKMRCSGGPQEFQHWWDELKLFLLRKQDTTALDALLADKEQEVIELCMQQCEVVRNEWADYSDGRSAGEDCMERIRALLPKENTK